MRLAAIDIGSNAIRLQITRVLKNKKGNHDFKKLEYIRFPLRLGRDTFKTGEISFRSEAKFIKLMKTFRGLIDLYEVDDFYGCATSAMRDAKNGKRILERSYLESGLNIELISGAKEASILNIALKKHLHTDYDYLLIDVGGGSTEISIIEENTIKDKSSFKLGSVRNMHQKDEKQTWENLKGWIDTNVAPNKHLAVGTGGNIRTLKDFVKGKDDLVSFESLQKASNYIDKFSVEERINELRLRHDRADVLPYASNIYLSIMKHAGCSQMYIPDIGLKDGIIQMLSDRNI